MPNRIAVTVLALAWLGAASGCSDSGDGPDVAIPIYNALGERFDEIDEMSSVTFAMSSEDLPTAGTASYEGIMEVQTDNMGGVPENMRGEMDVLLDFESPNDLVTGSAGNFMAENGQSMSGELDLNADMSSNNEIAIFEGSLDGTLTGPDDAAYEFSGNALGALKGDDLASEPTEPWFVDGQASGVVDTAQGAGSFTAQFATAP